MTEILDKQIEYSEDENYETLEKYKMIFTDIKFLLREYLKGGDSEYLNMICRSLGFDNTDYWSYNYIKEYFVKWIPNINHTKD